MITDLVDFLEESATVSSLVSDRIYPQILPQAATFPAITYNQVSGVRVSNLSEGPAGKCRRRITINLWAETELAAYALADAVRQSLNGYDGSMGATGTVVGSTRLDNEFATFEQDAGTVGIYRVIQDYIIAYLEA